MGGPQGGDNPGLFFPGTAPVTVLNTAIGAINYAEVGCLERLIPSPASGDQALPAGTLSESRPFRWPTKGARLGLTLDYRTI
jgi:hypothetical protein